MDVEREEASVPVIAVTAAVGAIVLLLVLLCGVAKKVDDKQEEKESEKEVVKEVKKQEKKKEKVPLKKKNGKFQFSHPWLAGSLKSHSSPVLGLDFSQNGKYIASCAEDRTVLLWNLKDLAKDNKSIRVNVDLDHATKVRFSPDSKALVLNLYNENAIRVVKIGRKDDGTLGNFQTAKDFHQEHKTDIINIGISANGRFIMTCSSDTCIKLWNLKGQILSVVDTHQMTNSYGAVSKCGRFIASSGFTPDVKAWEVCFDKSGNYKETVRAFELKGHSAGVYHFDFSSNTDRMVTVSKDGTWKLWDTNVEYRQHQDPKLLHTVQYSHSGPCLIALAPDGSTVALASGSSIRIYNAITTQCQQVMEEVHSMPITSLAFDTVGQYFVSSGDKNIHVFHNVVGYQAQISEMGEKKKTATTNAHRDRIQQQIDQAKAKLKEILE